jgi:NAD(P)-dependent dehydrogenase (short-subunit alcohol dehydrogenase family)
MRGGGDLVNIGPGRNKIPFPHLVSYTASKCGIEMFTGRCDRAGRYGIRVSRVAPGAIEIERTKLRTPTTRQDVGKITHSDVLVRRRMSVLRLFS